jgi:hypothetical protein
MENYAYFYFFYLTIRGIFMTLTLKIENPAVIGLGKEKPKVDWRKFRGAVSKQPMEEIDKQLKELRSEWERF